MEPQFKIGDNVVHPQHGLGTVKDIRETSVLGETVRVYVISTKKMELQIPIEKASELGVRHVVSKERAEVMLKILRSPAKESPFTSSEGWLERYEDLKRRIREGEGEDLAELVRDLDKNAKVYEPNVKEREILKHAKNLIIQELTLALNLPKAQVTRKVEDALKANIKKRVAI
ncbi:MAG: hypothetical protein D6679_05500 [Candidatus Hydrogenedentota bacterium]|nr:MAG: hypothetical protein D6679_05500 [Candidatus Hydrogenedentota bacterium]